MMVNVIMLLLTPLCFSFKMRAFVAKSALNSGSRDYESMGKPWSSIGETLDVYTNNWALSYADTRPFFPNTTVGAVFLATNLIYGVAGFATMSNGNILQSVIVEAAGCASILYHFRQINLGPEKYEVRKALMVDYVLALAAISTVASNAASQFTQESLTLEAVVLGILASSSLITSWILSDGIGYIIFHGLWHIFSGISVIVTTPTGVS